MLDCGNSNVTAPDGISLYFQWRRVDGARGVVLIVHGVGEHSGRYRGLEDWFCAHGFSCYGYDQRGHGLSGGRRVYVTDFSQYAQDLQLVRTLIDGMDPGLPVFLYSHSMGTLVALLHGLSYPHACRGTVLSSCPVRTGMEFPAWFVKTVHALARVAPVLRVPALIRATDLSHVQAVIDDFRNDRLVEHTVTLRWLSSFYRAQTEILESVHRIQVPLLVLHSRADRIAAIEGVRGMLDSIRSRDVTFCEYHSLYHELHNELAGDREGIFEKVLAWCSERV